jgi:hypothetical protein
MSIVRFPRRRGRPKTVRVENDSGTPELVMKRLLNETVEALDLCLERGIISREQHWCGIHLRWLYTLRYGAPGTRAIDPTHLGGIETVSDDPEWRSAREQEYHDAMKKLTDGGHALLLINICIHERPKFLDRRQMNLKPQDEITKLFFSLRDGLDILVKHWDRE